MRLIKRLFCNHNMNLAGNARGDIYKECTKCSKRVVLLIKDVKK